MLVSRSVPWFASEVLGAVLKRSCGPIDHMPACQGFTYPTCQGFTYRACALSSHLVFIVSPTFISPWRPLHWLNTWAEQRSSFQRNQKCGETKLRKNTI